MKRHDGRAQTFAEGPAGGPGLKSLLRNPRVVDIAAAVAACGLAALLPMILERRPQLGLIAVAGLVVLATSLALRPSLVAAVLGWLLVAPLLQESASASHIGHQLQIVLYELPPLLFLGWTWWLRGHRSSLVRPAVPDLLPVLLLAYAAGSILLSSNPTTSVANRLHDLTWNLGVGVVLYYVIAFAPARRDVIEWVTLSILGTTTFAALVAVAQYVTGYSLWPSTSAVGGGGSAATVTNHGVPSAIGTLGNPAVLGTVAGIGAVVAVSLLAWNGPARWRRLALASLPVTLAAVALSFERGPIIAAVVVGLAVVIPRQRLRLPVLAMLVVGGIVAVLAFPALTSAPAYQQRATNTQTINSRLRVVRRSFQLAELSPVLGSGYGTYDAVSRDRSLSLSTTSTEEVSSVTSHNTLLTMLVEIGAVGVILLLAHVLWVLKGAVGSLRRDLLPSWLAAAWLSGLAVYGMNAMAIDMRFFSFVCVLPWLCLGLLRRFRPTE